MKLLLVEDEPVLLEEIKSYLTERGFLCEQVSTFAEALEKISLYNYDALMLDIGLPDGNGLLLLKELKKSHPQTGVLIISAKDSLRDKLAGLDLGADDYITKPFYLEELNSRINALLRRKNFNGSDVMKLGEIIVDTRAKVVSVNHKPLQLTPKEYELLLYFIVNKNRVLSKQAIAEHLWGDHYDMADNYHFVYVHTNNLKKKVGALTPTDYIKSVYGMGYKFIPHEAAD